MLPAEERGAGAAISVLGYRLGMLVSGGLALWLADKWLGWQGMYWLMAALLIPVLSRRCLHQNQPTPFLCPKRWNKRLLHLCEISLVAIMRLILLLIVLYKLGDAFAMSLTTTF